MDAGHAAVGPLPVQPGESNTNTLSSLQVVLGSLLGLGTGGGGEQGASPPPPVLPSAPPQAAAQGAAALGAGSELQHLLSGLRSLVQRFEVGSVTPSTVPGWVPSLAGTAPLPAEVPVLGTSRGSSTVGGEGAGVQAGSAVADKPGAGKESSKAVDTARFADAAKCEVYVYFEGPLGAHLKPEVRGKNMKR